MLGSRIVGYKIKIKAKHAKKDYLSSSILHYLLGLVNRRPYTRGGTDSRLVNIGEYSLAMEILNFPQQLAEQGVNKIDFFIGKESDETFPVRDRD